MNWDDLSLIKVDDSTIFKPFDCGDSDLNEFLIEKSKGYSKELLATSFVLEDQNNTIAFFSIFNDSLRVQEKDFASKAAWKRFLKEIVSHPKRHLEYFPAIKIGRLAVTNQIQKSGIGKQIVNFIIDFAITQNKTCACKFITVDAYDKSLGFYKKIGFKFLSDSDILEDTRQMNFDLTPILNSI
jgi:GNAT superfamily N-acetyltransferase